MIHIQALGGLAVRGDDGRPLAGAATQPRRMAVLAILARFGDRGVSRDRMLAMLWPDAEEERARTNLAQAIYALRRDLGVDDAIAGTKELRLEPSRVATDVGEFCGAITRGQEGRAAQVYAGPFLDGFHLPGSPEFERWADDERRALAHDHARALETLARGAVARGDTADAVTWWRRLAALEPLNARFAIGLMEALTASGDRAAALRHARVYEVLLEQELDLPPDREVVALAERLRREATAQTSQAEVASTPSHATPPLVAPPPPPPPSPSPSPLTAPPDEAVEEERPAPVPAGSRRARRRVPLVPLAAAAALVVAAAVGATVAMRATAEDALVPGPAHRVAFDDALELDPVLSPDGKLVAYAADPDGAMRLYVRQVNGGGRAVSITEGLAGYHRAPRWSPDGGQIAFQSDGVIYSVPAFGGTARPLVKAAGGGREVAYPAWSPDGREIAYSQDGLLHVRALAGGETRVVAGAPTDVHSISWSPDGARIALVTGNAAFVYGAGPHGSAVNVGNVAPSTIWVVPAQGGTAVRVTNDDALNTSPVWMSDGRALLFVSNRDGERDVYRVALDADGGPRGAPARVTAGLGAHTIALSADGRRIVYSVFTYRANLWSLPIPSREVTSTAEARPMTTGTQVVEGVDVSPDGQWLAFDSDRDGKQHIYKMRIGGGDPQQLTAGGANDFMPAWSPNGRELAYHSFHGDARRLEVVSADGGAASAVTPLPRNQRFPSWAPDGRSLVFASDETGEMELYVVTRGAFGAWGAARRLTTTGGSNARWSPDGGRIAYTRVDGIWTIAPDGGAPRQVARLDPSTEPLADIVQWSRDGRALYYKAFDAAGRSSIWAAPADGSAPPRPLVRFDDARRPSSRPEFATDGRRFYFTIAERASDIWMMELSRGPAR